MKKIYFLVLVQFILSTTQAQIVTIPNANFKAKLLQASPTNQIASTQTPNNTNGEVTTYVKIDTNNDGEIQVSEALAIKWLSLSSSSISNLTGIESFTNLQFLKCDFNQLTSLNVSGLTNLRYLDFNNNQLPSINVIGLSNLQSLSFNSNQLANLDVSGLINLESLSCNSNQLTSLDVSDLINLQYLQCSGNQLPSINVSDLTDLKSLKCGSNLLSSLNVSGLNNLQILWCDNNQLPSLNLGGLSSLQWLNCGYNQLTSIDISGLSNLQTLGCFNNQLVTLFVKNGRNEYSNFGNNPTLEYICADDGQLDSIQNQINQYGYNNCQVNSYCSFTPGGTFYTIQGNNRYDSNSNGCDVNDFNVPNQRFTSTNGTLSGSFISNTSGNYSIPVIAGNHTITPVFENPSYFSVSPATVSVSFPTTASPFTQNFCIAPNGVHLDLEVTILPIVRARPGFDATYKIIYRNKGTQAQSGSLNFAFDDTRLDFVSATPLVSSQATNSLNWNYANLNPFETREITLTLNVNSPMETPAVNGGDVLNYSATIVGATDETPADNVFSLNQTVVNSFDPNDKTCLEGITITPSMVGNYVHYVIRFENTGTFAAQNIVVKDMIDTTNFDIASLIPQISSHPFVTRITNTNQVEFVFENINLPFDDANNDGYVAFKIKTKPTLVLGNTFTNTASIYFDYNFPIITNTATTTVAALGNQDFDFGNVFALSPVPAKDFLTITTKQAVVVSSVNIYNTLGQLVQVNTNPNETIDVSGLQSGSYFVRITSDKGSATGKFLKE
jgi:Leucine-rich repeat (LRR) protein